jgi:hypothetical protein
MCPIPNVFPDRAISLYISLDLAPYIVLHSRIWSASWPLWLLMVTLQGVVEKPHIFTTAKYADWKFHWLWQRSFRKCIVLGKLYQLCHLNNKYWYWKQYVISLELYSEVALSQKPFGTGHMYTYILFCLEWPILWPPRLLTFCIKSGVFML